MLNLVSKYIVPVLVALLISAGVALMFAGILIKHQQEKISKLETELGIVAAMSQMQEVKIIENRKVEEKLKVVTQDKIKYVTEYKYDENKSDCANAVDLMRTVF